MKTSLRALPILLATCTALLLAWPQQHAPFHGAPASAEAMRNPYAGQQIESAGTAYEARCAKCHGVNGDGTGNIPSLANGAAQSASDGEVFWYITKGDVDNGMPSWQSLPEKERWQIVSFIRVLGGAKPGSPRVPMSSEEAAAAGVSAPPPTPPFTDYRYEKPGTVRKITLTDLPAPFATTSSGNGPEVVPRPASAWPQVLPGI